jgi:HEAT repeat protein
MISSGDFRGEQEVGMKATGHAATGETPMRPGLAARIAGLIDELRTGNYSSRLEARANLTAIGTPAVPALLTELANRDWHVRWSAARALAEIGDPSAAPALVRRLLDRRFAIRWLAGLGLVAMREQAVEPLLRQLSRRPPSLTLLQSAHHVLTGLIGEGIDPEIEEILKPVVTALQDVEAHLTVPIEANKALDRLSERRQEMHPAG